MFILAQYYLKMSGQLYSFLYLRGGEGYFYSARIN